MVIEYLQYRYVKARMTAYLDGDLTPKARRFIARQIDENPLCYREYISAKQTHQELERILPTLGKADAGQLDAIWANIQSELVQASPEPRQRTLQPQYRLSYSVALLVLGILMLTPFVIDAGRSQLVPVAQLPAPDEAILQVTSAVATPYPDAQAIAFAVQTASETRATVDASIPLQNTPAPQTPRS